MLADVALAISAKAGAPDPLLSRRLCHAIPIAPWTAWKGVSTNVSSRAQAGPHAIPRPSTASGSTIFV